MEELSQLRTIFARAFTSFSFVASSNAILYSLHFKLICSLSLVSPIYFSHIFLMTDFGEIHLCAFLVVVSKACFHKRAVSNGTFLFVRKSKQDVPEFAICQSANLDVPVSTLSPPPLPYFLSGILNTLRMRSACFSCDFMMQ